MVLERVGVAAAVVHELADLRVLEQPGEAGGRDRASEQAALDDLSGTSIAPGGQTYSERYLLPRGVGGRKLQNQFS